MVIISEQNYSIYSDNSADKKKNIQLVVNPKNGNTIIHVNGVRKKVLEKEIKE
jgi:hypothetical protein